VPFAHPSTFFPPHPPRFYFEFLPTSLLFLEDHSLLETQFISALSQIRPPVFVPLWVAWISVVDGFLLLRSTPLSPWPFFSFGGPQFWEGRCYLSVLCVEPHYQVVVNPPPFWNFFFWTGFEHLFCPLSVSRGATGVRQSEYHLSSLRGSSPSLFGYYFAPAPLEDSS